MKKKIITIAVVIFILIALIPFPIRYKDGGTVAYKALLYSVYDVHSLNRTGGYDDGTIIEILGFEVFNNVSYK